jgi:hypothetical protein
MKKAVLTIMVALFATMLFAQTKTELKASELPKSITEYLAKNVSAMTFFKAFKVDSKGVITYDVIMAKGSDKRMLVFDKDGKFLKKADEEAKETLKNAPDASGKPSTAPKSAPASDQKKTTTDPAKK